MPTGIYKRTAKHNKEVSNALKGKPFHGIRYDWKGKHHSEETKKKMSISKKGINKGIKLSEEHKQKISKARLERKKKLGYINSPETRKKISGSNHHNWRGGLSPYPKGWTDTLRKSIRQRDNYVCQICGMRQDKLKGMFKKLDVHHIDYNKDNLNPNNLITLCQKCHMKTNYKRRYWKKYFAK